MKRVTLSEFLWKGLWGLALVLTAGVFGLNMIYHAAVDYDVGEKVRFSYCLWQSLALSVAGCGLLWAFSRVTVPSWLTEGSLFLLLTAVYTAGAAYLIGGIDPVLRADAAAVSETALGLLKGTAELSYLEKYPHQLGLVLYECALYSLRQDPTVLWWANLCCVIGINYTLYRTADLLFRRKSVNLLTILGAFAFLPQFFFVVFAYGLVPGYFCMTRCFYHGLRLCREGKPSSLLWLSVWGALAVCLKKNYLIGIAALVIYLLLRVGSRRPRRAAWAAVPIAAVLTVSGLLSAGFSAVAEVDLDRGCPSVLWVAMGTDMDNDLRAPGWYNRYNSDTFTDSGDPQTAAAMGRAKLRENLEKMAADPVEAVRFFGYKTVSQWCESLYGSVWSGPLTDCGQQTHTPLLQSLYAGGAAEDLAELWSKGLTLMLWGLCAVYLMRFGRVHRDWALSFLYFIGGLMFHSVWEGKSQYIYPYVITLLPFAAYAAAALGKDVRWRTSSRRR